METERLNPIGVYIRRLQVPIAESLDWRPIYDMCTEAERMPGTIRLVQWWDQDAVNKLKGCTSMGYNLT